MKTILKDPLLWLAFLAIAQMLVGAFVSHILFLSGCLCMLTAFVAKGLTMLHDIRYNQLLIIRDMLTMEKQLLDEQHQSAKVIESIIKNRIRKINLKTNKI